MANFENKEIRKVLRKNPNGEYDVLVAYEGRKFVKKDWRLYDWRLIDDNCLYAVGEGFDGEIEEFYFFF